MNTPDQAPCIELRYDKLPERLQRWQRGHLALPEGTLYVPFDDAVWIWVILGLPLAALFIFSGVAMGRSIMADMTQTLPWLGLAFSLSLALFGGWIIYKLFRRWRRQHEQRLGLKRYGILVGEHDVVIFDERATWFRREQLERAMWAIVRGEKSSYRVLHLDISVEPTRYVRHTIPVARLQSAGLLELERLLHIEQAAQA